MFINSYGELHSPSSAMSPGAIEIGSPTAPLQTQSYQIQVPNKQQQNNNKNNNNNNNSTQYNHAKRPSNISTEEKHVSSEQPRSPLVVDDPTSPKQSHVFTFPIAKKQNSSEQKQAKEDKKSKKRSSEKKSSIEESVVPVVVPYHLRIPSLDAVELRSFLNQVVAPGFLLQLIIKRNKSGVVNTLYPSYECYHEASGTHLMSGRKKAGNKTSNFEINMDKSYRLNGYLGKVRGNFTGSEYIIYDNGVNPKKLKDIENGQRRAREELCIVRFDNNIMGNCPRSLTAAMPQVELDESTGIVTRRMWKPLSQTASMMERFKKDPDHKDMTVLKNKEPIWNDRLGAYALNFNGRARIPSVKNFQLIHPEQPDYIMMQYGKMDKDIFTLDVQFPLSPLQAFGMALAGVDNKLVCD